MRSQTIFKRLKFVVLNLLGLVISFNLMAQNAKQITGTVKDSEGVPLPGATIVVSGTTPGTVKGILTPF